MNKKVIFSILTILSVFGLTSGVYAAGGTTISTETITPLAYKYITVTKEYYGAYPEEINYADEEGYQGTLRFVSAIDAGGGWWIVNYGGYVRQN